MPTRGLRSLCSFPKASSSSSISNCPSPSRRSFSDAVMERSLGAAVTVIAKWDPNTSTSAGPASLFRENRREAREFIRCVHDLQKAMHFLASEDSSSVKLTPAQNLMEIAMKRLQKEFYQILSMNRLHLDPESVSARGTQCTTTRSNSSDHEDDEVSDDTIRVAEVEHDQLDLAMDDLRSIAECMIATGYAKECVKIYRIIRKSIVDEGIYRLGIEKLSSSAIRKMDWAVLEPKMKNWSEAVKIAVKTLFNGERILCDHVFRASHQITESCFDDITREGAQILFGFPEIAAKSGRKVPEKVFATLDMYSAVSEQLPEIESIFWFESTSGVRSLAAISRDKLAESVRALFVEFESTIEQDASKPVVAGGGVHPLTIQVSSYLSRLADYSDLLANIFDDYPPPEKLSLLDSSFEDSPAPAISVWFAWLILVLVCKLDGKSKHYNDPSLSYLFLANNLQHVVSEVRTSGLRYLLGDDWLSNHEVKVKKFAANYERLGWDHVIRSMPSDPTAVVSPEEVKETLRRFNRAFELAYRKQIVCVVPDENLRDEIKLSVARKLTVVYQEFYSAHRLTLRSERNLAPLVRFAPADVGNYLSDLFFVTVGVSSLSS